MSEGAQTRCPDPNCLHIFSVETDHVGTRTTCPRCEIAMVARPLAIWLEIEKRQEAYLRGDSRTVERKADLAKTMSSPKRRDALYHRHSQLEQPSFDIQYEASSDRTTPTADANPQLCIVLDDLRSQWNVGAIFRTAECFGWGRLCLCGISPMPPARGLLRVSLGAESFVPWSYHAHVLECLAGLHDEGFDIVALEQTADAQALDAFKPKGKTALVLGNEVGGVSVEALGWCQERIMMPMAGRKGSLNVAVAFGVAAYELAGRWTPVSTA